MGRIDVIPFPIHLHGRPDVAAPLNAARLHARRLEELDVGGMIALTSDCHTRERSIDAQVPESMIVADIVNNPIVEGERRLVVIHVSVGQALGDDLLGPLVRIDEPVAFNLDLEGEAHIARCLRVTHHKLVLITPSTDELVAQHIGIMKSFGRREGGIEDPNIGIIFVNKTLLVLIAARALRATVGNDNELGRYSRLRLLVGYCRAPPIRIDAMGARRHGHDIAIRRSRLIPVGTHAERSQTQERQHNTAAYSKSPEHASLHDCLLHAKLTLREL